MRITNKVAVWIIVIYTLIVMAVFLLPLTVNAYEPSEEYITKLTQEISKDLALQTTPKLYFYNAPEWSVMASYYDGLDYIYVNLGTLTNKEITVRAIAHEMRHDYQYEHMNDDTEYGKAVKANNQNYVSYYNDLEAYNNQFIEQDAKDYADSYTKKYFNLVR